MGGYYVGRFLPKAYTSTYYALKALNVKITQIFDETNNPTISTLKFQFWKDEIRRVFQFNNESRLFSNPISFLLSSDKFLINSNANYSWIMNMIESRQKLIFNNCFDTLESVDAYGEEAYSCQLYVILNLMRYKDVKQDHIASHLGKAQYINLLIRSVYPLLFMAKHPTFMYPIELLVDSKVSQQQILELRLMKNVFDQNTIEALQTMTARLANRASQHLKKAEKISGISQYLFYSMNAQKTILDDIFRLECNPLNPKLFRGHQLRLAWNMWKASFGAPKFEIPRSTQV